MAVPWGLHRIPTLHGHFFRGLPRIPVRRTVYRRRVGDPRGAPVLHRRADTGGHGTDPRGPDCGDLHHQPGELSEPGRHQSGPLRMGGQGQGAGGLLPAADPGHRRRNEGGQGLPHCGLRRYQQRPRKQSIRDTAQRHYGSLFGNQLRARARCLSRLRRELLRENRPPHRHLRHPLRRPESGAGRQRDGGPRATSARSAARQRRYGLPEPGGEGNSGRRRAGLRYHLRHRGLGRVRRGLPGPLRGPHRWLRPRH